METQDEQTCPACKRVFKNTAGRNSHLKQAQKCAWYNQQMFEFSDDSDCEPDEVDQNYDNTDIALDDNPTGEEDIPGDEEDMVTFPISNSPSRASQQESEEPSSKRKRVDESAVVHDFHPYAGKVYRIDESVRDSNRNYVSTHVDGKDHLYGPFKSKTDWELAQWLIEEDIGKSSGERLIGIKNVSDYQNIIIVLKYF